MVVGASTDTPTPAPTSPRPPVESWPEADHAGWRLLPQPRSFSAQLWQASDSGPGSMVRGTGDGPARTLLPLWWWVSCRWSAHAGTQRPDPRASFRVKGDSDDRESGTR